MTDKHAIRAAARAARDAFVVGGGAVLPVPARYASLLDSCPVIAGYMPFGSEADPAPLICTARAAGCAIALPHVIGRAAPMRFLAWDGTAPRATGAYGLRQPAADAAELAPDIILTPLVAFDATLNRLGQGAGYYDAAFARFPDAWRIGIAYGVQQVATLPIDTWDVPLHAIITEQGWITP